MLSSELHKISEDKTVARALSEMRSVLGVGATVGGGGGGSAGLSGGSGAAGAAFRNGDMDARTESPGFFEPVPDGGVDGEEVEVWLVGQAVGSAPVGGE